MESNYDEDLTQNTFFTTLQREHQLLFERAIEEGWIICVPRCGTFIKDALTEEDFLSHILIPDEELPGTHFHTLTDREIRLSNRILTIEYDIENPKSIKMLFEETFYTNDNNKYHVWCVEGLLEQETDTTLNEVPVVTSLKECVDLLSTKVLEKNILKELDTLIDEFEKTHKNLENECLQIQRDVVNMLFTKGLQTLLKDTKLREQTIESRYFLQTIKIATETYILHGLRRILIRAVSFCTAAEDANLNKIIKNLHDLQLDDLSVRADLHDGISRGKLELSRLDGYFTVLGKIGCLKRAVRFVSQGKTSVSSDDLLPVIIFLVIKSGLANWCAQLTFMKQFRFSACSTHEADEAGFLVTSFEAAVEHVKSDSLKIGSLNGEANLLNEKQNGENKLSFTEIEKSNGFTDSSYSLFEHIKNGNLMQVQKILSEKTEGASKETKLCHPLCLCENCERSLSSSSPQPSGLFARNERGQTCLHVACSHGQVAVVEYLLEYGADPNDIDADGLSALHFAAARGHQNTLLLLLHANADFNALDTRGNTALHLATDHGHDGCVKALLYFAEQSKKVVNVSAMNLQGDTPLHFASKWGYSTIVQILMDYGADPCCKNRRGQTPMTLAHSSHVARLIEGSRKNSPTGSSGYEIAQKEINSEAGNSTVPKSSSTEVTSRGGLGWVLDIFSSVLINTSCVIVDHMIDPEDIYVRRINVYRRSVTEGMHKIDRLFAAVAEGDIRLASYYLGLEGPCSKTYVSEEDEPKFCHPLCNCEKCVSIEELSYEKETKPPIAINAVNSKGETALHIASAVGCTEIIQLLLDAGAKVNLVTRSDGRTPLHLACLNDRSKAVKMLLSSGSCNPDAKDNARDTPLHLSARAGNVRIVEMLVRHGANARIRNLNGATPLEEVERIQSDDIFLSLALNNIAKILKNVNVANTSQ